MLHAVDSVLTKSLIRKLTPIIDQILVWWYIIGIPAISGLDVNVRCLGNSIFAQTKIAIVYSRFNINRSSGTHYVVLHCLRLKIYRD